MRNIGAPLFLLSILGLFFLSYLFIDPNFFYLDNLFTGFAFSQRGVVTMSYVLLISALFLSYIYLYRLFLSKKINDKTIKKIIFFSTLVLLFSYPAMLSFDIFNYIATAKVAFFYHENPYIIMPIEFREDSILRFMHAANKTALYGPLWILLTSIPFFLNVFNFLILMFGFKLLVAIFYFLTLFVIWKMTHNWVSILLLGLNPLVIIETFVSGHNDIAMIFFALVSLYFLLKKRNVLAVIFLIFSILIKFATIFLIPLFLYVFYQKLKKRKIIAGKIYYYSFLSMLVVFFLSAFREEIYPWYAIWFLPFSALLYANKKILIFSIALSFGLMLRYIPFMLTGSHVGLTPVYKVILMWAPTLLLFASFIFKKSWQKSFFQ